MKKAQQKVAIAYTRISTAHQLDGISLEAQQAKIQQWATLNGMELIASYSDAAISGSKLSNRPAAQRAIQHACKVRGTLICYSLSRLSRSTKETLQIAEQLDKAHADLASIVENLDTGSASGKMLFRLMCVLNEFERDVCSERTSAALQHKRTQGLRCGNLPYGFTVDQDGQTLIDDEAEQRTIALICELRYQHGMSLRGIRDELQRRGILNRAGNAMWRTQTLSSILKQQQQRAA